jgi:hypothetical protein
VPPDDMTLTMRDAVSRRVQWRRTSIDADSLVAASSLTTPSKLNISPTFIFPDTLMSPSPNSEQLCRLSPIRE